MTRWVARWVACSVLLVPGSVPAEKAPLDEPMPVWNAEDLGRFVAQRMVEPGWDADLGEAARNAGIAPADLRVHLQVIEAHAVGLALRGPFQPSIAREAFMNYFNARFPPREHDHIRLELQKWGSAYSGAVEASGERQTVLLGYIRRVLARALEVDPSSGLVDRGVALWRDTVDEVRETCREARRQAIVVAD